MPDILSLTGVIVSDYVSLDRPGDQSIETCNGAEWLGTLPSDGSNAGGSRVTSILQTLKAGFSLAVPISGDIRKRIQGGVLVHRVSIDIARRFVIKGLTNGSDGWANARVRLTGETGDGLLHLMRATLRDHRVVDPSVFHGAAGRGFTDFVYFFLGEPEPWQVAAQNYGGDGEFTVIRVRGADLLSDPRREVFYRRGLFWEADRAVVVKGGYEGLAQVSPLPSNLAVGVM